MVYLECQLLDLCSLRLGQSPISFATRNWLEFPQLLFWPWNPSYHLKHYDMLAGFTDVNCLCCCNPTCLLLISWVYPTLGRPPLPVRHPLGTLYHGACNKCLHTNHKKSLLTSLNVLKSQIKFNQQCQPQLAISGLCLSGSRVLGYELHPWTLFYLPQQEGTTQPLSTLQRRPMWSGGKFCPGLLKPADTCWSSFKVSPADILALRAWTAHSHTVCADVNFQRLISCVSTAFPWHTHAHRES